MKIYLTRHSKTTWNEEKRLQGRKDSPLVEEGVSNALALRNYVKDLSIDAIYSSPIERAYKTAQLIFPNDDIIKDENLVEMSFGIHEGCKIKEAKEKDSQFSLLWNKPEQFTFFEDGESYDELIKRANHFIDTIKKHSDNQTIFVVTHGMFFVVLLCTMLGLEKKDFVQFNQQVVEGCSLTELELKDNKFELIRYNQCDYLPYVSKIDFK